MSREWSQKDYVASIKEDSQALREMWDTGFIDEDEYNHLMKSCGDEYKRWWRG